MVVPVFRSQDNLRDLYRRIVAIGDDQDMRGSIRCGSLLVEEMTIAGA